MTAAYRVGIIGAGFGGTVHAPAFARHPAFELLAIASPNRAAEVAAARGIPHAYRNLDEMLAALPLDVVAVSSPPFRHHADVLGALAAGKHVLCEKPLARTLSEAQEMVAAASTAGTVCGVAHEFRFLPERQALKELIVNRHLGALREIELTEFDGLLRPSGRRGRGWWFSRALGGGLTQARVSHLVDSANWLAGRPPLQTAGFIRTANPQRRDSEGTFRSDVDDGAFAVCDYGSGLAARIACDATLAVQSFTLAVHGETRTAVASGRDAIATTLFSVDEDETAELQCAPLGYAHLSAAHVNLPPFMRLLDEFAGALAGEINGLPSFADALATQRVLASIGYGEG